MTHAHHDHHNHDHAPAANAGNERRVFWAMLLTGGFAVVEVIGGLVSGSLALLADAGHMVTDFVALLLAWLAFRLGRRPGDPRRTFGYSRFQVLAAFVNGLALIVVVGWILIEAVQRLLEPVQVAGGIMMVVAVAGLLINLVAFAILHGGDRDNLNLRGAALHVLSDLLGSAAAIAAALVILLTGWMPIDPILSLAVALLIVRSAWFVIRRSAHILLEGTPDWLDIAELQRVVAAAVPAVEDVHHVHVWCLTQERPLITLHARLTAGSDDQQALSEIQAFLKAEYGLDHSTIQIERGACNDATLADQPSAKTA
ncbi:MAG: cation diffusion facilitator family transporter [Kiloniellales bacterium]|nr:cation diffusion facilitator family transporter [Kiloniellales bacterium]